MSTIDPAEMAKAEQILERVRDDWLSRDGVTAVDLGFKWSGGKMTPLLSIRVHVVKKKDKAELGPEDLFPKEVDGIPVDIIEATYAPQVTLDYQPEAAVDGRGRRFTVIPIGVSVGCRFSTAGTLGAKVMDQETGAEMILSNWHVFVAQPDAEPGLAIWQPGLLDGGRAENTIAELSRWVLGPYDAAVARLTGERQVTSTTLEGKSILDAAPARLGMLVWKSGRSSGYTEGFIDGVKMKVALNYREAGTHLLDHVFRIVPRPGSVPGEISIGGDSGSIWVDEVSGKAVGLHFAGEIGDSPEHALAHDIQQVLDVLKVRLPGQQPAVQPTPTPVEPPGEPTQPPRPSQPPVQPVQPPPTTGTRPAPRPGQTNSLWASLVRFFRSLFGS